MKRAVTLLAALSLSASLGPAALAQTAPVSTSATPASTAAPAAPARVQTPAGTFVGQDRAGVRSWLGIPYAQPPVGDARWQPPRALPASQAERTTTQPGAACVQTLSVPGMDQQVRGAEDCLFLNVYAPTNAQKAPVMVWIHGGSFQMGAGSDYDLSVLAREQGVVAVSLNYRLGALGFLATPALDTAQGTAGNLGLLDQQLALKWVRDNIAAFGGDAQNVTVFGESAGGMSICAQLASPGAAGLFDKAIIQSGPCTAPGIMQSRADAYNLGSRFAAAVGCDPADAACLRAVPADKLVLTRSPNAAFPGAVPFPPVYGDSTVPRAPAEVLRQGQNAVPLLIGTNLNEGTLFAAFVGDPRRDLNAAEFLGLNAVLNGPNAPRALLAYNSRTSGTRTQAAAASATDSLFACPSSNLARDISRFVPVYSYEFRDPNPPRPAQLRPTVGLPSFGAFHGSEIVSVTGTPSGLGNPSDFTPAQAELSRTMQTYWANFARTGNPNGAGLPQWAAFTTEQPQVLGLAPGEVTPVQDFRAEHHCDTIWRP